MKNLILLFCVFCSCIPLVAQQNVITVKGQVIDTEMDSPIPGVNVLEKNTSNGIMTDFDGEFSITVKRGATVTFSYIGYQTQEVVINDDSPLSIGLALSAENLDEVVLVGYGVQKKENLTGAASTISAEKIEDRSVTDVMQALQGAAPGLQLTVVNSGGEP